MFFLYNILLSALFIVLLSAIYFLGEKTKSSIPVMNSKIPSSIVELMEAMFFGAFFIGLQIWFLNMNSEFITNLFIVGFLVLFFVRGILFSSVVMAPGLLHFLMYNDFEDSFYLVIALTFLTAFVFELTDFFLETGKTKAITYIFLIVMSLIFMLISAYAMKEIMNQKTFLNMMMPFMIVIFVDFFFSYLIKFSLSANILYESINFVFSTYYRDSLLFGVMGNEISKKKISKGIFGVFEIKNDKVRLPEELKELKEEVLLEVKRQLPERALLFKFDDRKYAFFISTLELNGEVNIKTQVELRRLKNSIKNICKEYILENQNKYNALIHAGISFYGEQTSSIKELGMYSKYILERTFYKKNTYIKEFNYLEYKNNIKDVVLVQQLDDVVGLDNYLLTFMPIINIKTKRTKYMYSEPENISETQYIGDIRIYMESIDKLEIFERYYATEAIKAFKPNLGKFLIHFSGARISVKNYAHILINSLKQKNIDMKKIILVIRENEILNMNTFMENAQELNKHGITFASYLKTARFCRSKNGFKPNMFLINNCDEMNKRTIKEMKNGKIEIIHVGIKEDEEIFKSEHLGIKNIGGEGMQSNLFPKIFDKQSKIYLNKILKGRKT